MLGQRLSFPARMLLAAILILGSTAACCAHGGGGHGGGAGHGFAGYGCGGFRGGFGHPGFYRYGRFYGYPGYYGFPALFGLGLGLGVGYGLGYGYGSPYAYGSPYGYGYGYPYAGGYPVYVSPGYAPSAAAGPICPVAGQTPAPAAPLGLTDSDMALSIRVPPQAVVQINGETTTQTGPRRQFVSSGLSPGRTYTFVVTARWLDSRGRPVEQEQRVRIQGGERRNVDFPTPPAAPSSLGQPALLEGPGL